MKDTKDIAHFPKRILVTGGCGFIGSNFIRFILNKDNGIHITNLDSLTYAGDFEQFEGHRESNSNYEFIKASISDKISLEKFLTNTNLTQL